MEQTRINILKDFSNGAGELHRAAVTPGLLQRLTRPEGAVDAVLDTDTYNEIDDRYAIAYLVRSADRIHLQAVYAAPFLNEKCTGPKNGMELSYEEILRLFSLMGREDLNPLVIRGSEEYLPSEQQPVLSPAARDLAERAMHYTPEHPLYVIAIAAITNIASAILIQPEIIDRIVVIWLGGNAIHWPNNREFNLYQDIAAARVVFGCGAALVQLPCMGVVSAFRTSGPELEAHLRGKNRLCDYLIDVTEEQVTRKHGLATWSKPIWDVTAVGWLTGSFMQDVLIHSPIPEYDDRYSFDATRYLIRYVYEIDRDALFGDLFEKLTQ